LVIYQESLQDARSTKYKINRNRNQRFCEATNLH